MKKDKELTTYQALQQAKIATEKSEKVHYSDLMSARKASDRKKAEIANQSIKANIKKAPVPEIKVENPKIDFTKVKSTYA